MNPGFVNRYRISVNWGMFLTHRQKRWKVNTEICFPVQLSQRPLSLRLYRWTVPHSGTSFVYTEIRRNNQCRHNIQIVFIQFNCFQLLLIEVFFDNICSAQCEVDFLPFNIYFNYCPPKTIFLFSETIWNKYGTTYIFP